jgi:hypothetical protein
VAKLHLPSASEGTQSKTASASSNQNASVMSFVSEQQNGQQTDFAFDASFYPWPPAAATVTGLASADQDAGIGGWPMMDWLLADSPFLA